MIKIKIISVFLASVAFSLFGVVNSASATSCSAQISGDIFSWNVVGNFTSAKLSCPSVNVNADITDYLKKYLQGSASGYANNASLIDGCSIVLDNNVSCAITNGTVSNGASSATCSLNFASSSVEKGANATILWSSSGSFDSAKLVCDLAGSADVTDTLKSVPNGSLDNWQENSTGSEVCKIYFNNSTSPACTSNTLTVNNTSSNGSTTSCASNTCTGNTCWNGVKYVSGVKTEGCATVSSFSANPSPITADKTTVITWTSSAAKMEAECTGIIDLARGSTVTNSASNWKTGFPASFDGKTGSETCTLYPYDSSGNAGIPKSLTITVEKACECNGAFSGGNGCSSGQTCDGCYCVASATTGTTTGTTATTGTVNATCGSQAGQTVSYRSLSSSSSNLCSSGSVVTGFRQWCGLYDWHCGSSATWCNAYIQGSCGSVNGTTVSKGALTKDSANLCKDTKPSYFTDNGSSYTWKCGKDGCGDERSEKDGVVDCSATESGGSSSCECNGAFSGGNGCSSGQTCDGCHCVTSATTGTTTYSCTGTLPSGATMCDNDSTGLTSSLNWQSVGASSSNCTTEKKCEYYISDGKTNPTKYVSLRDDYGRATTDETDVHGQHTINIYKSGYIQYFRFFIPPGIRSIDATILEWQGQSIVARHKIIPTSDFGQSSKTYSLADYESADQRIKGIDPSRNDGRIGILKDSFASPYLSKDRAGWFYVKVNGDLGSSSYYNSISIVVDATTYNNWYDHSGSNADGSINWTKDIESVETYGSKTARGSGACTSSCSGSDLTCQAIQPANSTKSTSSSCCDGKSCYQCPSGYFWNTTSCSKLSDTCDLSATLSATPESGSSPLTVEVKSNISAAHGPIYCDNQDCNGGTVSNIDNTTTHGCNFTCTYDSSGTYQPKVHIANSACAKDPTTTVTVSSGTSSSCASETCLGNSCWNGTEYIQGTKTDGCATGSAKVTPDPLILPNTTETITWTTENASKLDAQCYGLKAIAKGGWFTSNQACQTAGYCDSDGYKFQFDSTTQTGQEVCVLFPYNTTDGKSGTPFFAIMNINSSTKTDGKCGTANKTYDATATSYGSDTFCTQGTASPASPTFPTASTPTTWTCQGTNGGADASCKATLATSSTATDGKCGTANGKNYNPAAPSWGSDTFCTQGTCPVEPSFTGEELMTWTCQGTNGGANTECYATLSGNLSYSGICGTSARTYSASAVGWGEDVHFCAQGVRSPISVPVFPTVSDPITKWTCKGNNGGTDTSCKAILSTSQAATQTPGYTCQPDDPYCAARTCKDLVCFDGCKRQQGTKNCSGQ